MQNAIKQVTKVLLNNQTTQEFGHTHKVMIRFRKLNPEQSISLFKNKLEDFSHSPTTFQRRVFDDNEIDMINNGGEELSWKQIPKIKNVPRDEDEFW